MVNSTASLSSQVWTPPHLPLPPPLPTKKSSPHRLLWFSFGQSCLQSLDRTIIAQRRTVGIRPVDFLLSFAVLLQDIVVAAAGQRGGRVALFWICLPRLVLVKGGCPAHDDAAST